MKTTQENSGQIFISTLWAPTIRKVSHQSSWRNETNTTRLADTIFYQVLAKGVDSSMLNSGMLVKGFLSQKARFLDAQVAAEGA